PDLERPRHRHRLAPRRGAIALRQGQASPPAQGPARGGVLARVSTARLRLLSPAKREGEGRERARPRLARRRGTCHQKPSPYPLPLFGGEEVAHSSRTSSAASDVIRASLSRANASASSSRESAQTAAPRASGEGSSSRRSASAARAASPELPIA